MNKFEQQVIEDQKRLAQKYRDEIDHFRDEIKLRERALGLVESFIGYLSNGTAKPHKIVPPTTTPTTFREWLRGFAFADGIPHTNQELTELYNRFAKKNYSTSAMSVKMAEAQKSGTVKGYRGDLKITYYGLPSFFTGDSFRPEYLDKIKKVTTDNQ